jgi:hypothetical protein
VDDLEPEIVRAHSQGTIVTAPPSDHPDPPGVEPIHDAGLFGGTDPDARRTSGISAAYASLPREWRTVLWHRDVKGRTPHDIAELLELSPSAVSALLYRARSALRDACPQPDAGPASRAAERACPEIRYLLPGLVNRILPVRAQERVHAHLQVCPDCLTIHLRVQETGAIPDGSAHTG